MYEELVVKKNVVSAKECQDLADYFLAQATIHAPACGHKGYGKNRRRFLAIDHTGKRTPWFDAVAEYQTRLAEAFGLPEYEESYAWISMYHPPFDLPIHIDPPTNAVTRLIALLQKPDSGGDVVVSDGLLGEQTVVPLGVGDVYLLPAHKYFHGITFVDAGKPRVAVGFDYKIRS